MRLGRFEKILEHLKATGKATFSELAQLNATSVDTVRRDLQELEEKGFVRRVRRGAVICEDDPVKKSFGVRSELHRDEKVELCAGLSDIITDGQTVALNNGTTNIEAAKFLCEHYNRLNIITNSIAIISYLLSQRKFNLVVPGGIIDLQEKSIYGNHCEQDICSYNIDVALLAVNAVSSQKCITDFRFNEVGIIGAMLKASEKSYVLADSSKFETVSCLNICGIDKIDGFLTDKYLSKDIEETYREMGLNIFIN